MDHFKFVKQKVSSIDNEAKNDNANHNKNPSRDEHNLVPHKNDDANADEDQDRQNRLNDALLGVVGHLRLPSFRALTCMARNCFMVIMG